MMRRQPIGTVVEIDGSLLLLNLFENARGHVASHPDGISTVGQPGDLIGVEGGADIIVVRVLSIAFAEPREVHIARGAAVLTSEPLRQLKGCVVGFLRRSEGKLIFTPQDWRLPVLGASAFPLSESELTSTIGDQGDKEKQIILGHDSRNPLVPVGANINDLLSRHIAVLGGTGQGKTHFVAAMLQRLALTPKSRIVIFDVNGEYADAFEGFGTRLKRSMLGRAPRHLLAAGVSSIRIPYFALGRHGLARLLLPSEKTQMPALRFAIEHLSYVGANQDGAFPVGQAFPVFFDDCRAGGEPDAHRALNLVRQRQGNQGNEWPHMRAVSCLAAEWYALKPGRNGGPPQRDAFAYGHIHSLVNRVRGLIEDERFHEVVEVSGGAGSTNPLSMAAESRKLVDELFGRMSFEENDWNVHIVDLSRLAQDLMPFVLGSLLELYASELFRRGPASTHPTLLVLEEAHHYLRQLAGDAESGQHALAYERLAKEGRKFGVSLLISTQRPSEVSPTVLAQCGTWAVFRLSNETDQRAVSSAAESVVSNVARQIPGLARGEAIVFGAAMPVATRLSVVKATPAPMSSDPPFVSAWGIAGQQHLTPAAPEPADAPF